MNQPGNRAVHAAGFTLVELMVALVLALLISAAVGSVYLGSTQSFRTGTGLSQLQEGGRFTSLLVAPVVRQAGYLADPVLTETDPTTVFLASNYQSAISGYHVTNVVGSQYPGLSASSIQASTDVLAVTFVGQSTSASTTDAPLQTCLGAPVYNNQIAVNVFYISKADSSGVSSLSCYTNVSTIGAGLAAGTTNNQPLIPGVSGMQLLFGIDAVGDQSSISYYNADQVATLSSPPTGFTNTVLATSPWLAVTNVQIAYTLSSTDQVELQRAGASGSNIDSSGRLTGTLTTTIDIRNRLHN